MDMNLQTLILVHKKYTYQYNIVCRYLHTLQYVTTVIWFVVNTEVYTAHVALTR